MKRPAEPGKSVKGKPLSTDGDFQKKYPEVTNYLCDGFWDDGSPREPSSLSVRMDGAAVHISISDHASQCSAYTSAPTLPDALRLLDEALRAGQVVWRPWKRGKGK